VTQEKIEEYSKGIHSSFLFRARADEKKYLPIFEILVTEVVPIYERVGETDFRNWFDKKIGEGKDLEFSANVPYYYIGGKWSSPAFDEKANSGLTNEVVFRDIYQKYKESGMAVWSYSGIDRKYLPVTDTPIATQGEKDAIFYDVDAYHKLVQWIREEREEYKVNFSNRDTMNESLNTLFESGEVKLNIDGKEYKIQTPMTTSIGKDGSIMPVIYFIIDARTKYGIYFEKTINDYALAGNSEENVGKVSFGISPYDKFVHLSDNEWEQMKVVNYANDFLRSRC